MLNPPIKYAIYGGTRLAMILGNADENVWNWFYSNHIQLYFNERVLSHGGVDHRIQFVSFKDDSYKMFVDEKIIKDKQYNEDMSFDENCKRWLAEGYYLQPYIDVTRLENTSYSHMNSGAHSVFIFGYEDSIKKFEILDYNANNKFLPIYISIESLNQAYSSESLKLDLVKKGWAENCYVKLYKFVARDFSFDINLVVEQLENYINGVNNIQLEVPVIEGINKASFGINVYDSMIDYIKNTHWKKIDIRAFKALVEHKEVMVRRLEYMNNNGYYIANECIAKYKEIEKKSKQLLLFALKYNMSGEKGKLAQICKEMKWVSEEEQENIIKIVRGVKK